MAKKKDEEVKDAKPETPPAENTGEGEGAGASNTTTEPKATGKKGESLKGAPTKPESFAFVGAITVSKSDSDGHFYLQFSNGKEAHSASNASHVGMLAQQFFQELLS